MVPAEFIESYLEKYEHAMWEIDPPLNNRYIGNVTHRTAITTNQITCCSVSIGQTGVIVASCSPPAYVVNTTIIQYADPDLKIKLHQAINDHTIRTH